MAREHHKWELGTEPPIIPPHSRAKLRVFDAYLRRYVAVLTANVRKDQLRLTLVDGFAGGGLHRDAQSGESVPGSPLIMLQAMEDAEAEARARRTKEFRLSAKYVFVEKDGNAHDFLRATLDASKLRQRLASDVQLINGDFLEHVAEIVGFIKKRGGAKRAIFILDQFGYKDAPFSTIHDILGNLKNAEVILTFAVDRLMAFLGENEETQRRLESLGIVLPSSTVRTLKRDREWRRTIQFALHEQIRLRTGADFYTPFFIRSATSNLGYWLIHLSRHPRARDVMVDLHWREATHFAHHGRAGLRMLAYDPRRDDTWTKQSFLPGFHFDETAKDASTEELLGQLPERIWPFRDGIPFEQLFASLTNETPVTSEIMKGVLADLAREGILKLKDKSGTFKRGFKIEKSDIILPSPQTRIQFDGS